MLVNQSTNDTSEYWIEYDPPPIPIRSFDWRATEPGYEPGAPIGWGSTREEAIADLESQLVDD